MEPARDRDPHPADRREAELRICREDMGMNPVSEDLVVLLDPQGQPCGTADRSTVHSAQTPLHLAFSCYVVDAQGRILMTRRALTKRTFPGVWTNACCGHPQPGEAFEDAIGRRLAQELGARATAIAPVLPDFRYEAVDALGIRENEICPVFVATVVGDLEPDPTEVMEHRWVDPDALASVAAGSPWLLSPWSVEQITQLDLPRLGQALAGAIMAPAQ
jgi:isopentenyl-diphosphate delta-isomerase type 1